MSKYKVSIAKERISRLTEKYSRSLQQEDVEISSSESVNSVESRKSTDEEKHFPQHSTMLDDPVLPETNNNMPIDRLQDEFDRDTNEFEKTLNPCLDKISYYSTPGKKLDISELNSPSSESLVPSDLSNQFERIRFISSSSENDLSVVQSEHTQTKSISTKLALQGKAHEQNTNTLDKNKKLPKPKENFTQGKNSSLISLSEANDLTDASSIKELMYSQNQTESTSDDMGLSDSIENNDHAVQVVSSLTHNSEELSLKLESRPSSQDNKSSGNRAKSKIKKIGPQFTASDVSSIISNDLKFNVLNEKKGCTLGQESMSSAKNLTKFTKSICHVNKSTNTDPVKIMSVKKSSKYHGSKPEAYFNKTTRNINKIKNNKLEIKRDNGKNSTKRTFIEPCKLISQDEIRNIETLMTNHEPDWVKYNLADYLCNNTISTSTLGTSNEEVITQLLKNQVQLTRHFIENHQRMYLQVCRAAQLLNENHLSH